MQVGQRPRNRKPKSRAVIGLGQLAFDLFEWPAQPPQRLGRDPDPGVGNQQHDGILDPPAADDDLAAVRREFDGVGEQIDDDLLGRAAIGHDRDRAIDLCIEIEVLVVGAA